MTRTVVVASLLVLVSAVPLPAEAPLHIAILGDRTGSNQAGVYEGIVAEVERLKPDLVITVGDQIEGYTEDPKVIEEQWKEYCGIVAGLSMPFHIVPGNHDITTDAMLPAWEAHWGKPYHSFDRGGVHFVVLDTSRWEASADIPKEQVEWLERDLAASGKAGWTLVFFHKPLWWQTVAEGKPDVLHDIFRKHGVDAVFTGHFHEYFSGTFDGIRYTNVGSSGGETEPGPTGLFYHFAWVTVEGSGITIAPVRAGAVGPWDETTVAERKTIDRIQREAVRFTVPVTAGDDLKIAAQTVRVAIAGAGPQPVDATLTWDVPEGWTVEPASVPVKIEAGGSRELAFRVASSGSPYPSPVVHLRVQYAQEKSFELKSPLRVSRRAVCTRTNSKPAMDGQVTESLWRNPVTRFFSPEGGEAKTDPASFHFACDDENLYLAGVLRDGAIGSAKASATERDGAVHADDCAGFFLHPGGAEVPVFQFYVNPIGTVFDVKYVTDASGYIRTDRDWNAACEVRTARDDTGWSFEARIPLADVGGTCRPGDLWGINFRRKQPRLKSNGDWLTPVSAVPEAMGVLEVR